jgi:hypothetical protein
MVCSGVQHHICNFFLRESMALPLINSKRDHDAAEELQYDFDE